jgi:hypothetical protein
MTAAQAQKMRTTDSQCTGTVVKAPRTVGKTGNVGLPVADVIVPPHSIRLLEISAERCPAF